MKSPVLRFPDDQPRRRLHAVAVLEPEHRVLRQWAVVDLERGPRLRQALQRHVNGAVLHVVEHGVTMAEGAALDVFAGDTDAGAVGQHGGKGQLLRGRPVDGPFVRVIEPVGALLTQPFELLVHGEAVGHGE